MFLQIRSYFFPPLFLLSEAFVVTVWKGINNCSFCRDKSRSLICAPPSTIDKCHAHSNEFLLCLPIQYKIYLFCNVYGCWRGGRGAVNWGIEGWSGGKEEEDKLTPPPSAVQTTTALVQRRNIRKWNKVEDLLYIRTAHIFFGNIEAVERNVRATCFQKKIFATL